MPLHRVRQAPSLAGPRQGGGGLPGALHPSPPTAGGFWGGGSGGWHVRVCVRREEGGGGLKEIDVTELGEILPLLHQVFEQKQWRFYIPPPQATEIDPSRARDEPVAQCCMYDVLRVQCVGHSYNSCRIPKGAVVTPLFQHAYVVPTCNAFLM